MIKRIILLLLVANTAALAQRIEFGAGLGTTFYKGELAEYYTPRLAQPAAQLLFRYNKSPAIAHRANIMVGRIAGDYDASNNLYYEKVLKGKFSGPIADVAYILEYNFLDFRSGKKQNTFATPYVTLGAAAFLFRPGETERKTPSVQPAIPVGVGFKYALTRNWNLSGEFVARKTFTGLLDDYNDRAPAEKDPMRYQRGYKNYPDWYMFLGVNLTYVIYTIECPQEFMK